MKPFFSVVIPTFDRATLVRDAIDSVLAQGEDDVEIVVIDDGSTDTTREVLDGYDGQLRYRYQPNRGASAARNAGIAMARGEWVSFLDSDDVYLPGKMAAERQLMVEHPAADVIVTDSEHWSDGALRHASWLAMKRLTLTEPSYLTLDDRAWVRGSLFATCNLTIRRRMLAALGEPIYDPAIAVGEDWDLELRLLRASPVLVAPWVLARVRRFEDDPTREKRFARNGRASSPQADRIGDLTWRLDVLRRALARGGWPAATRRVLGELEGALSAELRAHENGSGSAVETA